MGEGVTLPFYRDHCHLGSASLRSFVVSPGLFLCLYICVSSVTIHNMSTYKRQIFCHVGLGGPKQNSLTNVSFLKASLM